jgi:capsular polysaccharide biosynthesis protein
MVIMVKKTPTMHNYSSLTRIAGMFWLRRYLLITPVLLSIPLGLAAAIVLPKAYVARTLLLLQETGGESPLSREVRNPESNRDRISGLQALIKSERIMKAVLKEVLGTLPNSQIELAHAINELTKSVNVDVLTNDVIEVRLRGSQPHGMGKTLESITARLLESLLAPEDVVLTAPQMLVERRREQMEAAERALASVPDRLRSSSTTIHPIPVANITTVGEDTARLLQEKRQVTTEIDTVRSTLPPLAGPTIEDDITRARQDLQKSPDGGTQSVIDRLTKLVALEQRRAAIDAKISSMNPDGTDGTQSARISEEHRKALETALQSARDRYAMTVRRFGNRATAGPFQILRAPEKITIIDPAKDPELPIVSRNLIFMTTLICGLMIGVGLVLGSDQFDPRVRSQAKVAALTGLPIWGRLPYNPTVH